MKNRIIRAAALGVLTLAAALGALQLSATSAEAGDGACWRSCIAMGGGWSSCSNYCGNPN